MNVKERNSFLAQGLDALRFVGKGDRKDSILDIARLEVDWHKMHKPPIESYIPPFGLNSLWEITNDVKLMNRPDKRVRYMDDLLKQFNICFLNAGTNRRIYYHTLDPYIVFKVGSDQVGRSDNISEYHMQNNIFPFCTRTYSVLPNGMIALSERVEVMTEYDYKTKWASEIFDLVLAIIAKGYIMEDIGGNFYKNLGVRIGFGPVFIDYPYVYKVDLRKTLCSYINPITGEKCDGELDYDYDKGMSEIVCDKCGTRFSAKHLAAVSNEDRIETRKGKFSMDNNFKISVVRGNDTVLKTYNESEAASIQQFSDMVRVTRREQPKKPREIVVSPKFNQREEVKPQFRVSVGRKSNNNHRPNNNSTETFSNGNSEVQQRRGNNNPPKDELMPDINQFLYEIDMKHGRGSAIYLARRLGVYYTNPNDKPVMHEQEIKATLKVEEEPKTKEENKTAPIGSDVKEDETLLHQIANNGEDKEEAMIPVKPKTAAELAAMDKNSREENVVMGFPGEPLVDTMRIEQTMPVIAKALEEKFNHKVVKAPGESDADFMRQLEKDAKEFLENNSEMNKLFRDGLDGLEVNVNSFLDHVNKVCFLVKVEMHKSSLVDVTVYPSDGTEEVSAEEENTANEKENEEMSSSDDHNGVNCEEFFEQCMKNYAMHPIMKDLNEKPKAEAMNILSRKLLSDIVDAKQLPYAVAHEAAKEFACKYLGIDSKSVESVTYAADEL